jgi:dethiobiotin synthetase
MRGLFFSGTDTGVGKTCVTAAVARQLRRQGFAVGVCKPVATGAEWVDGRWLSADTRALAEAAGLTDALERVTPWVFPDPVAPPVAARRQGVHLDLVDLIRAAAAWSGACDVLLVEGVGGLLCPLTERATVADLVAALGLPLVVVARRGLGTLNHTLLTVEAARARGLPVAGVVVNETAPPEELRRLLTVPLLTVVPFQTAAWGAELPAVAAVDWRRLCGPGGADGPVE